jgi:hypothetical protein
MAVAGEPEPRHVDPGPPQLVELSQEMAGIDHHAVRDHRRDVGIEDARGDQLELEEAALGDHRVAGIVPTLIADNEVHPVREVVDGLALALVPPLRPEHDRGRHVLRSVSVVPGGPAAVPSFK